MKKGFLLTVAAVGAAVFVGKKVKKIHECFANPETRVDCIVSHMDKKLSLTLAQQETIKSALRTFFAEHKSLKGEKKALKEKIHTAFRSDTFEAEEFATEVKEQMCTPFLGQVGNVFTELHAALSPQQRDELMTLMEKKHGCCSHS